MKKPTKNQSPKKQFTAFRKAARELGADESEVNFNAALKTVAKHKPVDSRPMGNPEAVTERGKTMFTNNDYVFRQRADRNHLFSVVE